MTTMKRTVIRLNTKSGLWKSRKSGDAQGLVHESAKNGIVRLIGEDDLDREIAPTAIRKGIEIEIATEITDPHDEIARMNVDDNVPDRGHAIDLRTKDASVLVPEN